jgi:hypothetical protein
VSLSSGDVFYIDGIWLGDAQRLLSGRALKRVGSRLVNPAQVAQVTVVPEVPSVERPERLDFDLTTSKERGE